MFHLANSIARKAFRPMITGMSLFSPNIGKDMFNSDRLAISKIPEETFQGSYLCGLSTYILGQFYSENFDTQVIKTTFGYGKYLEDHCYILLNNEIIVDPTIRQFLNDPRGKGKSDYCFQLYQKEHPIFVGTRNQLEKHLLNFYHLNKKSFGNTYLDLDEINFWWSGSQDYSFKMNHLGNQVKGQAKCDNFSEYNLVNYLQDLKI